MPSRTARLSKKGCGFATPECRAQRDVAVHPRPAPPPPLLAALRLSTTALGDLEIRWVVSQLAPWRCSNVVGGCILPIKPCGKSSIWRMSIYLAVDQIDAEAKLERNGGPGVIKAKREPKIAGVHVADGV